MLKLKCLTYLIFFCYIFINCGCYQELFLRSTSPKFYCSPPLYNKNLPFMSEQAVFFIAVNNSDDAFLDDCLLTKRSVGMTTMLLRDVKHLEGKVKHIEKHPDRTLIIVVVVQNLNMKIIYHFITKFLFESHRSTVYMVITTKDPQYGCDKGVFDQKFYKTIEEFLNRIWHAYEIFNVVVEFPFVCPGYFIIYDGKRRSKYNLYDRTIITIPARVPEPHDMLKTDVYKLTKGYPLRANIFQRFPTSIRDCENMNYYLKVDPKYTNGMCGMDAFIMHDILRHFEFNTTFPNLPDVDGYGFVVGNNVTGSLGQLLRNEFDISFNSRFMVQYLGKNEIQFLHYVSFDSICAVLKAPEYLPLWFYSYYFLTPCSWGVLLSLLILSSLTNKIITNIRKSMGQKTDCSSNVIDLVLIGIFGYSNKRLRCSILGGICLLISIVICACFQGHVNYVYTALLRTERIKTLTQLHSSNIKVYTPFSYFKLLGDEFQSKDTIVKMGKNTGDVLHDSHVATLKRRLDVMMEIRRDYLDEKGWPLIYIVRQCYCNNYLSYITRNDFLFTTEIKVYIMKLLESGLPDAYYQFTQDALKLTVSQSFYKPKSQPRPFTPTNMPELRVAFCFLCCGYFLSTTVLVFELWWHKRSKGEPIKFLWILFKAAVTTGYSIHTAFIGFFLTDL